MDADVLRSHKQFAASIAGKVATTDGQVRLGNTCVDAANALVQLGVKLVRGIAERLNPEDVEQSLDLDAVGMPSIDDQRQAFADIGVVRALNHLAELGDPLPTPVRNSDETSSEGENDLVHVQLLGMRAALTVQFLEDDAIGRQSLQLKENRFQRFADSVADFGHVTARRSLDSAGTCTACDGMNPTDQLRPA